MTAPDRSQVERHLARSGGRLACPHPAHRVAQVPGSPARIILPECAGHDAWLKAREEGIGGSEVGALIGVSGYETPFSVWNTKKNGGKDLSDNAAVEWGHRMEDVVAQKVAEEIGLIARFAGGLWANKVNPILRVTPDRLACKPRSWIAAGVIECKTAGEDEHWQSGSILPSGQGSGSAPLSYQAQLQWQLGILGLKKGWLGCFHFSRERQFFLVEVDFNAEWFSEMVEAANFFWTNNILADEPPMHDLRHPKTEELLKQLAPHVVKPSVDLPEDAAEWLVEYKRARKKFDEAEADLKEVTNYFRMHVGDAAAGFLGEKKVVTYPEISTSRIDVEALRRDYPEIADRVTVRSTYRALTVRPPKDLV